MRRRKFSATSRPSWKIVICFIVPAMPPDNSKRTSHNGVAPAWFPAVTAGTHADTNKVTANALAESKAPRIFTFLLDRHRPRERLRDTRSRDAQRLQQGLEILAPGRSLHGSAQLHDSRLRRAPLACSREAQIPAQRREFQLGALAVARDLQPVIAEPLQPAHSGLEPFDGRGAGYAGSADFEGVGEHAQASVGLREGGRGNGGFEQARRRVGLDVLEANAPRAQAHARAQPGLGRDPGQRDAQASCQYRERIAAPLEVGNAA